MSCRQSARPRVSLVFYNMPNIFVGHLLERTMCEQHGVGEFLSFSYRTPNEKERETVVQTPPIKRRRKVREKRSATESRASLKRETRALPKPLFSNKAALEATPRLASFGYVYEGGPSSHHRSSVSEVSLRIWSSVWASSRKGATCLIESIVCRFIWLSIYRFTVDEEKRRDRVICSLHASSSLNLRSLNPMAVFKRDFRRKRTRAM